MRGVHELNWQLDGHNFQTSKFVGAVSKCYHHKGLRGKFRLEIVFLDTSPPASKWLLIAGNWKETVYTID